MEVIEISKIVADENKAIEYMQEKGILKKFEKCPYWDRSCKKNGYKFFFIVKRPPLLEVKKVS